MSLGELLVTPIRLPLYLLAALFVGLGEVLAVCICATDEIARAVDRRRG